MKVHYFQRYTQKENVATANTMLLISRLYRESTSKFFDFLQALLSSNKSNFEVNFTLQEYHKDSVPDATISQPSFKIIVETKMKNTFKKSQLLSHLKSFDHSDYKVLLTLASEKMSKTIKKDFENELKEYNEKVNQPLKEPYIQHINITFEEIIKLLDDLLEEKDYKMREILNDYIDYCVDSQLLPNYESWKTLRMQLSGTTYDFNTAHNVYYDKADRGFRPHEYLGLYRNKKIEAIGKICTQIVTNFDKKDPYIIEKGTLTEKHKEIIQQAIEDSYNYGYDLTSIPHRYFFVDQFYNTNYNKVSKGGAQGTRYFDISDILNLDKPISTDELATRLDEKEWR